MQEAADRFNRFFNWVKVKSMQCFKKLVVRKRNGNPAHDDSHVTKTDNDMMMDGEIPVRNGRIVDNHDSGQDDDKSISSCECTVLRYSLILPSHFPHAPD